MKFRNLMITLQTVFVIISNIQALPVHSAVHANDMNALLILTYETGFAPVFALPPGTIAVQSHGKANNTSATLRAKRFEWLGEIDNHSVSLDFK